RSPRPPVPPLRPRCLRMLVGHSDEVWSVSVSPDGRRAVSGSRDGTLRLWDLGTGACLAVYHAGAEVDSVVFSPDGRRIVCGTLDGQLHFLTPVNLPPSGPPLVTPVRLWLFGAVRVQGDGNVVPAPGRGDDRLTVLCSWCGRRFPVRDDTVGRQIPCPLESCGKPLQINPFVVDGRDAVGESGGA
ncbi:MAG: hypothetical protein JXR77_02780, partial [Lentisphaeria bacterium]|nr:hypothetical protein [Lentisphaeria bacterium]